MVKTTKRRKSTKQLRNRRGYIRSPQGVIQPHVEEVGSERFGIVAVDCAKARSKWMLCNFYGKVIVPPTVVEHNFPMVFSSADWIGLAKNPADQLTA